MTCPLQRDAWTDFRREFPWLREAHGALVNIACIMRARLARGEASNKAMNLLRMCVSSMGGTPTGKLSTPLVEDDPDDALFQRYST
jgi:hypothetical protein